MNWTDIVGNWNRHAAVGGGHDIDADSAYTLMCTACAPFARGMRHFALPALTFEADGATVTSPGDLLPTLDDASLSRYAARLDEHATSWRLGLTEPLFTDPHLWSRVRDLLMPLWHSDVGLPVLPVASELILAKSTVLCEPESTHVTLAAVLSGEITFDGRSVSPGEVVHLPTEATTPLVTDRVSLALRLRVPVGRRLAAAEALKILTGVVAADAATAAEPVPQPPFPPPVRGHELVLATSDAGERPPHRPDFVAEAERLAHVWWAGRAGAAGLDPTPDPDDRPPLRPDDVVRLAAPILVTSGADPDTELWAVNGTTFTVGGPVPGQVLRLLRTGEPVPVERLCRDADGDPNGAEPLIDRLHDLRAVTVVEGAAS